MARSFFEPHSNWKEGRFDLKFLWIVVAGVTSLFTIASNGLIVAAMWKDPNRNLRSSPSGILICSQAIADFFVGLIQEPLCMWWLATFSDTAALAIEIVGSLFMIVSIFHVVALTFDRYVAIVTPLQYTLRITKTRLLKLCVALWIYSTLYMLVRSLTLALFRSIIAVNAISGLHTVLPSFACTLIYTKIFVVIRSYRKSLGNLDESGRLVMTAYAREKQLTKAMVVAFLLFLFCVTPWFVFYQIIDACPTCEENKSLEMYLFSGFYFLFMCKSALNAFLYAWRLPKFRTALKQMIGRRRIAPRAPQYTLSTRVLGSISPQTVSAGNQNASL